MKEKEGESFFFLSHYTTSIYTSMDTKADIKSIMNGMDIHVFIIYYFIIILVFKKQKWYKYTNGQNIKTL